MEELIRYLEKIAMQVVLFPLKLLPTKKNRVILDNCLAHNYADNMKPIAEALRVRYPGVFDIYISVTDEAKYAHLLAKGLKVVRYHSLKYFIIAMTSRFFITNSGGYSYLPLKKDQYVINTWHGGGAYKKFGVDLYSADRFYTKVVDLAAHKTSMMLSTCHTATEKFSKALMVPEDRFWEIGMPRNDILVQNDSNERAKIRKKLGIGEDEKLVLYAPTYRQMNDNSFGTPMAIEYGIDIARTRKALETRFGGKWIFAVRLHPTIKNSPEFAGQGVMSLTDYDDMQELLLAADVMINDFSSSFWDFMLTRKPCFIYAKDLEHYIATTALYTPVSKWPFPITSSNDELEKAILEFDEADYRCRCDQHYEEMGGCESGRASIMVSDKMFELMRQPE